MAFVYTDLNSFTPTVTALLVDVQSVYQSLYNILNTKKGERLFEPDFGIALEDDLFELDDDITQLAIMQEVITAVSKFEQRVLIDTANSTITVNRTKNTYDLVLLFSILGVNGQTFSLRGSFS